jgi:hypothetical protein
MWCVVRVAARVGDLVGSMAIIAVLQQTQASMVIGCYLLCRSCRRLIRWTLEDAAQAEFWRPLRRRSAIRPADCDPEAEPSSMLSEGRPGQRRRTTGTGRPRQLDDRAVEGGC